MSNLENKTNYVEMMRHRGHQRRRALSVLGAVVVLATALALMMPAISMTRNSAPQGAFVAGTSSLSDYPAQSFSHEVNAGQGTAAVVVQVEAPEGALPANTKMTARLVEDTEVIDAAKEEAVAKADISSEGARAIAVDIAFFDEDGNEVEPLRDVNVSMRAHAIAVQDQLAIVHVDDENKAAVVPVEMVDTEGEQVVFTANQFSVYALVYTVDFEYEVNGKLYGFTLKGQDAISLRVLVDALHVPEQRIDKDSDDAGSVENTTAELSDEDGETAVLPNVEKDQPSLEKNDSHQVNAANDVAVEAEVTVDELNALEGESQVDPELLDEFMADIESVEFTDESLLKVCKVDEDMTLMDLKIKYGFFQDYDYWKLEEWLHEFNSKPFEAGDWALVSLMPFDTEEALTITLKTGEQFTIKVTDSQAAHYKSDGVTVDTITNPAGTTFDLFDYWVFDDKKDAIGRLAWDGFQNRGTDGQGLDWGAALRGTTGNYQGINSDSTDGGHALKFSPAYSHTIYDGAMRNWHQETDDGWTESGATNWSNVTQGLNSYTMNGNPRQGIVESTLTGGYPTLTNNPNGIGTTGESLAYLFDPSYAHAGKASYTGTSTSKGPDKLLYVDEDGYYTYDSRYYSATFDESTNEFTVAKQTETDTEWESQNERRGFWPFGTSKFWSGMHMSAQFSMPTDGVVLNPQGVPKPMQFEFSGDDDTWIYVDGVLIGDGGGIHNRTEIDINFQTGEVSVYGNRDPNHTNFNPNLNGGDEATGKYTNGQFVQKTTLFQLFKKAKGDSWVPNPEEWKDVDGDGVYDTFADITYHTFDMFYLERGGGESNLYIHYNLVSTADFTAHKALHNSTYVGDETQEPNILRRNQFTFDLIGLDGQFESVRDEQTGSYVIRPVAGGENKRAISLLDMTTKQPLPTNDTALNFGDKTVEGWVYNQGVTEDGNVNFGFANIDQTEMSNLDAGHPSVYRYIVLEEVPEDAMNAQGHTWGELKASGNWDEMAQGGFKAIDPISGGMITYGITKDGKTYSPVQFMAARVTKWTVKDADGNDKRDSSGNLVYEYGLSKTYYKDQNFFEKDDNVAENHFIDIRNAWEPIEGDVEFSKVDSSLNPLPGAEFTFYSDSDCTSVVSTIGSNGVVASNDQGIVELASIASGIYYFKETRVPDGGYCENGIVYVLEVKGKQGGGVTGTVYRFGDVDKKPLDYIVNTKPNEISVMKKWVNTSGKEIDGGDFEATVQLRRWKWVSEQSGDMSEHTVQVTFVFPDSGWNEPIQKNDPVTIEGSMARLSWGVDGAHFYWDEAYSQQIGEGNCNIELNLNGRFTEITIYCAEDWASMNHPRCVIESVKEEPTWSLVRDTDFPTGSDYPKATIALNKENKWAKAWTISDDSSEADFPKTDGTNNIGHNDYCYDLVELAKNSDGTYSEISINDELQEGVTLKEISYNPAITNEKPGIQEGAIVVKNEVAIQPINVVIKKIDGNADNPSYLAGAKFRLEYRVDEASEWAKASKDAIAQLDDNGEFAVPGDANGITLAGLVDGQYRLVETEAPHGYVIDHPIPVVFTVSGGAITSTEGTIEAVTYTAAQSAAGQTSAQLDTFTIPNTPGKSLPSTGGAGTIGFTLIGVLMVALGVCALVLNNRVRVTSRKHIAG